MDARLIAAAKAGNAAEVSALLSGGVDARARDGWSRTALHWASCNGHATSIEALLADGGSDVLAKDRWGGTALDWARKYGHEAAVEALLAGGCDVVPNRGEEAGKESGQGGKASAPN